MYVYDAAMGQVTHGDYHRATLEEDAITTAIARTVIATAAGLVCVAGLAALKRARPSR